MAKFSQLRVEMRRFKNFLIVSLVVGINFFKQTLLKLLKIRYDYHKLKIKLIDRETKK